MEGGGGMGGRRDREERRIKVREGKYFILVKIILLSLFQLQSAYLSKVK